MFQGKIIIKNGKIVEVIHLKNDLTIIIDNKKHNFGNAYAYPGFIDSHIHLLGSGEQLSFPNLADCKSAEECAVKLIEKPTKRGNWIFARGWNNENWLNPTLPSKDILDKYFPNKPVALVRIDGHCIWVNSKALELCKIDELISFNQSKDVLLNDNNQPTGILIDNAMNLILSKIPQYSTEQLESFLIRGIEYLTQFGITEAHDMDVPTEFLEIYRNTYHSKTKKINIRIFLNKENLENIKLNELNTYFTDDAIKIVGIKLFMDGALGSYGALLFQPYEDNPSQSGFQLINEDELMCYLHYASKNGLGIAIHCIGDLATKIFLDYYEKFLQYSTHRPRFVRIEHSQIVRSDDVERYKKLGISASVQPYHFVSDIAMAKKRLGHRCTDAYRWKSFIENGIILCSGSDFPVDNPNPLFGINALVNRQNFDKDNSFGMEEISIQEALKTYYYYPKKSINEKPNSISVGNEANITVLDTNILESQKSTEQVKNLATISKGKIVHCAI